MKFYRTINLIILILVSVIFCISCSRRDKDNNNGTSINIFRPNTSRVEQYNASRTKGTTRPEVSTISRSLRDIRYDNDNETLFGYIPVVIGFLTLIAVAVIFERYLVYRMKITADSPTALFIELCAAHQLTRMERSLIERVAEAADINDPLPIFIEPKYLQNAIDNPIFRSLRQSIEYLLAKLFETKSETSIIKRSSILIQSELNNESKSDIKSGVINDSTITYATAQIQNNNLSVSDNSVSTIINDPDLTNSK
ncbi:MAG: hypothetical protein LBE18_07910 [Planctomycetaceae bacterium]|jgi:hypothetical protein|nr:hypothetical protein [Planctomycetaceae bacterium]